MLIIMLQFKANTFLSKHLYIYTSINIINCLYYLYKIFFIYSQFLSFSLSIRTLHLLDQKH